MSGEVPEGWASATLGEVIRLEYGRALSASARDPGNIPVYGSNGVCGEHSMPLVPERGIVVGRKGTAGSVTVTTGPFWPIDTTYYVVPRLDVDFDWLAATLEHARLHELNESTGVPGLNRDKAYLQSILLPPLDEQRRIAEVLRSVDEAIATSDEAYRQSLVTLQRSMEAALHVHAQQPPDQWTEVHINQLGKIQAGRQRAPSFTSGKERPYLRVANVFDGYIDLSDVLTMRFTDKEFEEYNLRPGDILLNEGQSLNLVGRAAMYMGEPATCCFQNTLVRFRAESVSPMFAYALTRTLYWAGRLSAIATQTTSVAHLGVGRFANLRVFLPPSSEQREIADAYEALASGCEALKLATERLRQVRQAISSDLLSGRVRAPA